MKEVATVAKKFFNDKKSNNINEFVNLVNLTVRLSDFISQFINLSERGNSYVESVLFIMKTHPHSM